MRTRRLGNTLTLTAMIGAMLLCGSAWAAADGWSSANGGSSESKVIHDSRVETVSYSTGEQGAELKWLPYRSAKSVGKSGGRSSSLRPAAVRRTEFRETPAPSLNAADDPLNNPFGDAKRKSNVRRIARARGPNARGPLLLRPIAASKDAMPLPGLAKDDKQLQPTVPKLLLSAPSDKGDGLRDGNGRRIPTVEEELAANQRHAMDACPPGGSFKSIRELSDDVSAKQGKFPRECALDGDTYEPRAWTPTTFAWTASGTCHKPLYFEQVQVERYGHSWGPLLQPLLSGGHFFVTVPILPYKMGMYPPGECMYSLGYYRPGSCAPYMLDPLPLSVRGGLMQAGAMVGAAYLIP